MFDLCLINFKKSRRMPSANHTITCLSRKNLNFRKNFFLSVLLPCITRIIQKTFAAKYRKAMGQCRCLFRTQLIIYGGTFLRK